MLSTAFQAVAAILFLLFLSMQSMQYPIDPSGNSFLGFELDFCIRWLRGIFKGESKEERFEASFQAVESGGRINEGLFLTDPNIPFNQQVDQLVSRFFSEGLQTGLGFIFSSFCNNFSDVEVTHYGGATLVNRDKLGGYARGMTLPPYILSQNLRANAQNLVFRHEYGHTIQSRLFGILYIPRIGIPSLVSQILEHKYSESFHNHNITWFEIQANQLGFEYLSQNEPQSLITRMWRDDLYPRDYNQIDDFWWGYSIFNPFPLWWMLYFNQ